MNIDFLMVKIILVGIIVALVYSQPNLRLTIADWLSNASEFLNESVDKKQEDYKKLRFKTNESIKNNWEYRLVEANKKNQRKPDNVIICLIQTATKIKIIILLNIYFT